MSQGGRPDLTFGTDGVKAIQIGTQFYYNYDNASAPQPDGKIVVVGAAMDPLANGLNESNWSVGRFSADGVLDPSFGVGGISSIGVTFTSDNSGLQGLATAEGVAIQPDGKIVVVGNIAIYNSDGTGDANNVGSNNGTVAEVARLNADGSIDTTFGVDGIVTLGTVGAGDTLLDYTRAVAILPGGQIAVSGAAVPVDADDEPAVELLNPDGSVDTAFGQGGLMVIPTPTNTDAALVPGLSGFAPLVAQPDGKIVVENNVDLNDGTNDANLNGSDADYEVLVTRLDADGTPDPTFGTGGQEVITGQSLLPYGQSVLAESLAIQPDGALIIGGAATYLDSPSTSRAQLLAVRLTPDGANDPTFGIDGANILTGITPDDSIAGAIAIQPDGKIVLGDRDSISFVRLDADGLPDTSFGTDGTTALGTPPVGYVAGSVGLAIEPDGDIISTQCFESQILVRILGRGSPGDYDDDGISDPAVLITGESIFAAHASGGIGTGEITQFGTFGAGNTLPAPGAYDGDGISELAVYLPKLGAFAVRPYDGGPDVITGFGTPGVGNSLPDPGDYDASGRTEYAVYLPASGTFAYRPANGGLDAFVPLGIAGPGQSIPASADYYGTGEDDFAVYLPRQAAFEIRNPATGQDVTIPFGMPGVGNSIPVPGDYDGSGRDELAVYVPSLALLIYRPADGGPDVQVPFELKGAGMTIPAPGDYDGSGHTEVAGYKPSTGTFTYLPADGGPAVSELFGPPEGASVPFSMATDAVWELGIGGGSGSPHAIGLALPMPAGSVEIPLTPDVLDSLAGPTARKKTGQD